ncbi:MAG: thioesterase-like protein [Rhodospirillaceae bacterium]|nr:thioesterase-like protein [Rhodospirillaceae bacterium]|tara:strand:+ start:5567 stop:6052 length:486 start_codon:yes stop_codon:yes gene_type:complete
MTHAAPLGLWQETIRSEWTDYNRHMNVAYYTLVFDHAVDEFFSYVGLGRNYRETTTGSTFAVEHHITYNKEVVEGDEVRCETRLVGYDDKRIHHYHEMFHVGEGYLAATCEFLSLHVDLSTRRVSPFPTEKLDTLSDLLTAHSVLPEIENLGRIIKTPAPK